KLFVGMKVERKPQSGMEEVPRHLPSGTEVRQGYHIDPKDQPRARKPYTQPRDSSVPSCVSVFSSRALFGEPSTSPVFVVGASTQVLCERVEGSLNTEEVLTGLRINSPTGIPECGADALRSTLCSTSFRSQCGIDRCG
ncbi:hypothetical protein O3P69_009710, partial [Scylla paramamosain]